MVRATSKIRKHRAAERVYVASDARDNHYMLAEIQLTDKLIELVVGSVDTEAEKPYQKFYRTLTHKIFDVVEEQGLTHVNLVANNKLVRVRYSGEQQVLHTDQQSFFFYCPEHNNTFKAYFDGSVRTRKVKVLFLATGTQLRANSGQFHSQVHKAIKAIADKIGLQQGDIKLRDHQHLTFDVFAKEKAHKETITRNFSEVTERYQRQGYPIEGEHTSISYAIASIPMARRLLKGTEIDYDSDEPFTALYKKIELAFRNAAEKHQIKHAALVANGASPFVRYEEHEVSEQQGELISYGFNPKDEHEQLYTMWQGDSLADTVRIVFFAAESDEVHSKYGKFANQVIDTIKSFADEVNWKKEHDDIMLRVHQHIMQKV